MIVTLGDLTLDVLVKPDRHAPGRPPDSVGSVTMTSGGPAANFAVWIARLGGDCRFIGKVGRDPAADLLTWDLLKEGVLPETVAEAGSTATLTHVAKANGDVDLIADRGVAVKLKPEEVLESWLADATWLHLPAEAFWALPVGAAAAKAVRVARQAGAKLSIDISSAKGLREYGVAKFSVLLKTLRPDVILAGQEEAMMFAAGALGEIASVAVLRLGAQGCAVSDEKGYHDCPSDGIRPLEPSGAADAFTAAWCFSYSKNGNAEQACQRANTLYARVAAQVGARPTVDLRGIMK